MTGAGRARPIEFEARDRLGAAGYYTLHFSGLKSPVNLVGLNPGEVVLVKARRVRGPITGIAEVHETFRGDADLLRRIGGPRSCRKELWVFSQASGWKHYEVFPGGLMETAP